MTKENIVHLGETIAYIFLLMFFTYTPVFVAGLKTVENCWQTYVENQSSLYALLTNFGLLFLIVVDYTSGKSRLEAKNLLYISTVFFIDVIIYGHAKVMAHPNLYKDYECLLEIPWLFAILHWITIGSLIYYKYQTLKEYNVKLLQ